MNMTKDKIYQLAISSGFKPKEQPDGTMDLNPYVYQFAENLIADEMKILFDLLWGIRKACGDDGKRMQDELVSYIAELKAKADTLDELNSRIAKHSTVSDEVLRGEMVVGLEYIEDLLEPLPFR